MKPAVEKVSERKTSVMHITYDMRIGGTEMVIKNIIEGSDQSQFTMSIFCIESPLGPWGEALFDNGTEITIRKRKPGFDVTLIKAIRQHLKTHAINIVHCHQYTPWVYGVLAAFGLKTKVIFTEHGRFYPDRTSWKRRWINPLLAKVTDRFTAISKATRQALIDYEFLPGNRIEVVYNGIQPLNVNQQETLALRARLSIPENAPVVGTIARLDPIKNHKMMIDAFSRVIRKIPDAYLVIVGDGEERANIENSIREYGLESRVVLPGYDPNPQHYLNLMDVFLLSSLSEGTSMTLLEAMSLDKPCVVTNAGGNPEIIEDNVNGIVTENNDSIGFSRAIIQLLEDRDTLARMSHCSKERFVKMFTAAEMNKGYTSIYR